MLPAAAENFLIPATSPLPGLLALAFFAFMIWGLIDAGGHRRWGWFWSMLVFGPFAVLAWMAVGRASSAQREPQ